MGLSNCFLVMNDLEFLKPWKPTMMPGGLPQGVPGSPFLSILILKKYMQQAKDIQCVGYADDFVFFGQEPFKVKDFPEDGIKHAEEKCKWLKYDGK